MAEENKEKYSIDFQTNADAAAKDVQDLRASIDQTTEATKKSTTATDAQEEGFKSLKTQLREAIQLQQQMSMDLIFKFMVIIGHSTQAVILKLLEISLQIPEHLVVVNYTFQLPVTFAVTLN